MQSFADKIKQRLKQIHPTMVDLNIQNEECVIFFSDGESMVSQEFKIGTPTRNLMDAYLELYTNPS